MPNPFSPREQLLLSTPLGLTELGCEFNPHAPFTACRLCGELWQTPLDRLSQELADDGEILRAQAIAAEQTDLRHTWLEHHNNQHHDKTEIEALNMLGWAMMPSAAHRLAPFGIAPTGNLHNEIIDAMATAPRAPNTDARAKGGGY